MTARGHRRARRARPLFAVPVWTADSGEHGGATWQPPHAIYIAAPLVSRAGVDSAVTRRAVVHVALHDLLARPRSRPVQMPLRQLPRNAILIDLR